MIFFDLDVDSRTIVKHSSGHSFQSRTFQSYYHVLLHPKLLLVPSISMKDKIGVLLDATTVKSPAKFILSTSEYLWVTLHSDNQIRIWGLSDGRCLATSQKELFPSKLQRIVAIPTHDGHLLCFDTAGDVYLVNMFRMTVLKHLTVGVEGVSLVDVVKVDESFVTSW